ncbi:MAG: efflux transporter outer membrane subunit [Pseudomonadota bacterium]
MSAVLLVAACATTETPEPPGVIATLSSDRLEGGQHAVAPSSFIFQDAWWVEIGGAPLDRLVAELQAKNLDVRAAVDRISQAEAAARSVGAVRLPQVSGEITAGGGRGPNAVGGFDGSESYGVSVAASWDTDIFGGRRAAARSAALSAAAAELNAQAVVQSAIAQLAEAYVGAWALGEQIRIAEALAQSFEDTAALTNQRYRTGSQTAGALDTLIARQNEVAARSALPELEALRAVQLQRIDLLLGRPPGSGATVPSVSPAAGALPPTPTSAPADYLLRRPDVAATALAFQAALADLDAAEAARRPSLALTGVIALQNSDIGDLFDADRLITDLAAGLTAPIFQGGRLKAEAERAAARASELANAYGQSALRAASDLERALALSAAYDQEIALREDSVAAAALSDQIASERYASGQASLLAVLETRRALNAAQRDLISAREAALNARIDLALAAGGGWGAPQFDDQGSPT